LQISLNALKRDLQYNAMKIRRRRFTDPG